MSRKITQKAVNAFLTGQEFKLNNTKVLSFIKSFNEKIIAISKMVEKGSGEL